LQKNTILYVLGVSFMGLLLNPLLVPFFYVNAADKDEELVPPAKVPSIGKSGIPTVNDPNLQVQLVIANLSSPSQMEFLGPNDILILEKNTGQVKRIVNGVMLAEPLLDVPVATLVERGMLGMAIAKHENGPTYVFLYYTLAAEEDGDDAEHGKPPLGNRLVRYELVNGTLEEPEYLFNVAAIRGASHNSGEVIVGLDGNIYFVVGDIGGHKGRAQNVHIGSAPDGTSSIFRITQDGQSAGNILGMDHPANKIYAYGIRNSFGIDFDPVTGKLWDTENGPTYGDEINLVEPGFNSGWNKVSGFPNSTVPLNPSEDLVACLWCGRTTGFIDTLFNKMFFGVKDGQYSDPEFSWYIPVGPTALKFLNSDKLGKQYENDMFVADIMPGKMYHFDLNEARDGLVLEGALADKVADNWNETESITFAQGFKGITDIDVGPDGYLYVLTHYQNASIYRIAPVAN
jgi:glucose/arabinose dehydrogenase